MIKRIAATFAAIVAAVAVGLAPSSPALAALQDCSYGSFCMWTSTNYTGARFEWTKATIVAQKGISMGSGVSNRGYSFFNRVDQTVTIFDRNDCNYGSSSGWKRNMVSGQYATAQGSDWGGRVSSVTLYTYGSQYNCAT